MAVSHTTLWRFISGILGVICVLLMATLGIVLKNSFAKQSNQTTFSSEPMMELQEGPDCCSCPDGWIGYQCNCYFISNEARTWEDSRHFCAVQNSSLLKLQNRDELSFWNHSQHFYWIGLSYREEHGAWLWEDDSAVSQHLFPMFQGLTPKSCILYSPRKNVLSEDCKSSCYYICKKLI
uniref:Natural killer cells antigen CD94 n=2 Tax=Oryctolagus cuniculus TaxID=9986 RepID=U3KNA3_RABIT